MLCYIVKIYSVKTCDCGCNLLDPLEVKVSLLQYCGGSVANAMDAKTDFAAETERLRRENEELSRKLEKMRREEKTLRKKIREEKEKNKEN